MIMADVLKIFLLVVGAAVVTVAHVLAAHALAPRAVARSVHTFGSWRRFLAALAVGILVTAPLLAVAAALHGAGNPVARALALVVAAVPLLLGLAGAAGMALRIGHGLPSAIDQTEPWRPALRGAIVLVLCFLAPVVGWFLLLPATLLAGAGALVLGLRGSQSPVSAQAASTPGRPSPTGWNPVT